MKIFSRWPIHPHVRYYHIRKSNNYIYKGKTINALQTFALLETVHAYMGFTSGKVMANLIQWAGRSAICGYLSYNTRAQTTDLVFLLFGALALSESIRYPYYFFTVR